MTKELNKTISNSQKVHKQERKTQTSPSACAEHSVSWQTLYCQHDFQQIRILWKKNIPKQAAKRICEKLLSRTKPWRLFQGPGVKSGFQRTSESIRFISEYAPDVTRKSTATSYRFTGALERNSFGHPPACRSHGDALEQLVKSIRWTESADQWASRCVIRGICWAIPE